MTDEHTCTREIADVAKKKGYSVVRVGEYEVFLRDTYSSRRFKEEIDIHVRVDDRNDDYVVVIRWGSTLLKYRIPVIAGGDTLVDSITLIIEKLVWWKNQFGIV
ncbi:MAG: hypothetical protein DRN49_00750 [Thaumarchaeota archaeon]|nr:MAG: hypothetical protein DRN49_00750 [Nitrososphaerota archaeon]